MLNPHLEQPILASGEPLASSRAVALLFHGRGRTPEEMLELAERLANPHVAYLAPTAAGNTWYPASFMEPLATNEPALSFALERYDALVHELLAQGFTRSQLMLIGFSQGACLTAEYAARHADRYGGVIVFTGGLIGPPGTRWQNSGTFAQTPMLLSGSTADPFVPAARMRESAAVFRSMGATVTEHLYAGTDHVVTTEELALAREILRQVAG